MSWMDNIERFYFFTCNSCEGETGAIKSKFDPHKDTATLPCPKCGCIGKLEYTGWENLGKFNVSHKISKVAYDQNGRKAYKIGKTYMSKTKYNYLESGKVQNEYTHEYERKLRDDGEKSAHLLQTETNTRRAIVTELKGELQRRASVKTGSKTVPQK